MRAEQEQKRQEWGDAYVGTGRVWTHENGEEIHPDWMSRRFKRLVELSGLPPVRLHDLVRVENFNDRYLEDQRSYFSLTRFTIARTEAPGLAGCLCRLVCRLRQQDLPAVLQAVVERRREAGPPPDLILCPLRVHWILV
ncbi:hypothetical protein [Streptomyces sp. NPDC048637]|uniref:hypothetical protein n=1 Tax=Streptomyces sp. NPDC048637 TaxID=3155636 RepID=UPI00341D8D6C